MHLAVQHYAQLVYRRATRKQTKHVSNKRNFTLLYLSDIPDEQKNGEANDYNDDYEDDFNPTRCRV